MMICPTPSKDLPGQTADCMPPSRTLRRPMTEKPQRSCPQARSHSLRRPTVVNGCLRPPAEPRNPSETRRSSAGTNLSRSQHRSSSTDMNNIRSPEAVTTKRERRESSQGDLYDCGGLMLDRSSVQGEDGVKGADFVRRPSGRSDSVQASRTTSRLMAKTAILAAAPVCHLVVINYAQAHGLLLLPGSEPLSGDESCRHQTSFGLHTSWLDCPDSLLLLAASMAWGSLMLSYHQLNIADESQTRILIVFVCVSMAFGLYSARTLLAMALSILPWAIYAGLGFSDLWHIGRTCRMVHKADDDGGRRAHGVCEKV